MVDPEIAPYFPAHKPGRVTVKMKEDCSKTIIHSKRAPEEPMTMEELRQA